MSKYPTFESKSLRETRGEELEPEQYQGVHFTVEDHLEEIVETIEHWFEDEDAVILIGHGKTAGGVFFIILEWEGYAIPASFLEVLDHDDDVEDYSIYMHDESEE
jgi:hypothetical protein